MEPFCSRKDTQNTGELFQVPNDKHDENKIKNKCVGFLACSISL